MSGALPNANALALVTLLPSGLCTPTPTVPDGDAGVTTVRTVELSTVTMLAGNKPNVTPIPSSKPVPVMVTVVPPVFGPAAGTTEVIVGNAPTGKTVNEPFT